jgi:hypothetical protein
VSGELAASASNRVEAAQTGLQDALRGLPFGLGPQHRGDYVVSLYFLYIIRSGIIALIMVAYIMLRTLVHLLRAHGAAGDRAGRLYLWVFVGVATFAVALLTVDQDDTLSFFFILAAAAYRSTALEQREVDKATASAVIP